MALAVNNVATFDSQAAELEILSSLVKTSRVYAPVVQNHMTMVPQVGSRVEWFDQNLGNNTVTLSSNYTAGDGEIVISASSLVSPYSIKVGVHQVQTKNNSAIYNITAYDSGTNTLTVTLAHGSDANIASGTELYLIRNSNIGEDFPTTNDTQFATSDYNYLSNFSFVVRINNMSKNNQLKYHFEEISFENQLQNNIPEAIRTLERRAIKDFRVQGSGAGARNGNTIQGGDGARAGGILTLASARGLYTASSGSAAFSQTILDTDMRTLRLRGAFSQLNERTRDMGLKYCKAYCGDAVISDVNKSVAFQRAPESFYDKLDKIGGQAGTFTNLYIGDGVVVDFQPSDGFADNEVLYVPQDDLIEVRVVRMMEEQPALNNGDNEIRMYNVTYSTTVKSPYLLGYRSNLIRN